MQVRMVESNMGQMKMLLLQMLAKEGTMLLPMLKDPLVSDVGIMVMLLVEVEEEAKEEAIREQTCTSKIVKMSSRKITTGCIRITDFGVEDTMVKNGMKKR